MDFKHTTSAHSMHLSALIFHKVRSSIRSVFSLNIQHIGLQNVWYCGVKLSVCHIYVLITTVKPVSSALALTWPQYLFSPVTATWVIWIGFQMQHTSPQSRTFWESGFPPQVSSSIPSTWRTSSSGESSTCISTNLVCWKIEWKIFLKCMCQNVLFVFMLVSYDFEKV